MLSRSIDRHNKKQAWAISAGFHLVLAVGVLWIVYGSFNDTIEIVVDAPVEAPVGAKVPQISAKPKEPEKPKQKPKAVYGFSRKSATADDGIDVKRGNTVAKAPDDKKLDKDDPDSLPIPEDEVLVTRMPKLRDEIRIPYPSEAKKAGVQGAVIMDLLIDSKGAVREAKLVGGPGSGLDEAALEAVKQFRFEPALIQDKPVAVRIRYAYRFVLER